MDSLTREAFITVALEEAVLAPSPRHFIDPSITVKRAEADDKDGAKAGAKKAASKRRSTARSMVVATQNAQPAAEELVFVEKSAPIIEMLRSSLSANFLFRHLDGKLLDKVVGLMRVRSHLVGLTHAPTRTRR